jgi:hypothetical protein
MRAFANEHAGKNVLKGIKQLLLLLEEQVRQIEMLNCRRNAAIADIVRDYVALD